MPKTQCARLRCQTDATFIFRAESLPDGVPVCNVHRSELEAGAPWAVEQEDGRDVLLLGHDADLAWPRMLRAYSAQGGKDTEIEKGKLERTVQLGLTYGRLGVPGSVDLELNLSLNMAREMALGLLRVVDSAPPMPE